jgi:hypothetical protein
VELIPAAGSRKRAALINLTASITVNSASTMAYLVRANNLNSVTCPSPKLEFKHPETDTDVIVEEEINVFNEIEGFWKSMTIEQVKAVEAGEMWISVWCGEEEYVNKAEKDPESGRPINITMAVTYTVEYGSVFYWPDTPSGKKCALEGGDVTGCNALRQKIENPQFDDATVTFQVGGSATAPAGGFYQVSAGSNLPVVVGVTISCLMVSLVAIGAAVYFRKHPDKWDDFKGFGPKKIKSVQRSFATHV